MMNEIEVQDEAGTFRIIPDWVIDSGASPSAIMLYLILKQYARDKGQCYPSKATIAGRMEVSERHVATLINELEFFGCIIAHRRFEKGKITSNLYLLPVVKGSTEVQFSTELQFQVVRNYSSEQYGTTVPTKEKTIKEKTIKETGSEKKDTDSELLEFVLAVKQAYPEGCKSPEWSDFTRRAKTALNTKAKRDKYLQAVKGYKATNPDKGYVKRPASLINKVDDYLLPDTESKPASKKLTLDDVDTGWK